MYIIYIYFRRADLEEANFHFSWSTSAKIPSNTIKETKKQVKQATNKKRRAYNKISPANFITHEIYVFGLFWQINEILYPRNFLAVRIALVCHARECLMLINNLHPFSSLIFFIIFLCSFTAGLPVVLTGWPTAMIQHFLNYSYFFIPTQLSWHAVKFIVKINNYNTMRLFFQEKCVL